MKISKSIIIISFFMTIISLLLAVIFSLELVVVVKYDKDSLINIFISVMCGAGVLMITTVCTYIHQRTKHLQKLWLCLDCLYKNVLVVISYFEMDKKLDGKFQVSDSKNIECKEMLMEFSIENAYFLKKHQLDNLTDSSLSTLSKIYETINLHAVMTEKFANGHINEIDHRTSYNIVKKSLINDYKPIIVKYQKIINSYSRKYNKELIEID